MHSIHTIFKRLASLALVSCCCSVTAAPRSLLTESELAEHIASRLQRHPQQAKIIHQRQIEIIKRQAKPTVRFSYQEFAPVDSRLPYQDAPREFLFAENNLVIPAPDIKKGILSFYTYSGRTLAPLANASVPLAAFHDIVYNTYQTYQNLLFVDFPKNNATSAVSVFDTFRWLSPVSSVDLPKKDTVDFPYSSFRVLDEQTILAWTEKELHKEGTLWLINTHDGSKSILQAPSLKQSRVTQAVYASNYGLEVLFVQPNKDPRAVFGTYHLCFYDTQAGADLLKPTCRKVFAENNYGVVNKLLLTKHGVLAYLTDGIGLINDKVDWSWHLNDLVGSNNFQETFFKITFGDIPPVVTDDTLYLTVNDIYQENSINIHYSYIASIDLGTGTPKAMTILAVDDNPACTIVVAAPVADTINGYLHILTSTQVVGDGPDQCLGDDPRGPRLLTLDAKNLQQVSEYTPSVQSRGFWQQRVSSCGYYSDLQTLTALFPVYFWDFNASGMGPQIDMVLPVQIALEIGETAY